MGNNQNVGNLDKQYVELKQFNNESYGMCKLYKSQTDGNIIARFDKSVQNVTQYERLMKKLDSQQKMNDIDFVPLYYFQVTESAQLCSSVYKISGYYQFME